MFSQARRNLPRTGIWKYGFLRREETGGPKEKPLGGSTFELGTFNYLSELKKARLHSSNTQGEVPLLKFLQVHFP